MDYMEPSLRRIAERTYYELTIEDFVSFKCQIAILKLIEENLLWQASQKHITD